MALTFGAANSDRVDHGALNALDDAAAFTVCEWVYCTTRTNGRRLYSKGGNAFLRLSGTTGNLQFYRSRDTAAANFITNSTPLATNTWIFVALTYDATANPTGHIYTGTLAASAAEATYGTSANGSGTITGANSDAADTVTVGNFNSATAAFQGSIASAGLWTRALSLGEIITQQWARRPTASCVLFTEYGWNGIGTQPDWSGSGNAGTVTGASLAATHVPVRPHFVGSPVFVSSDVPATGNPDASLSGGAALGSLGASGTVALTPIATATGGAAFLSLGASGAATLTPTATVTGGAALLSLGVTGAGTTAWPEATATGGAAFLTLGVAGTASKFADLTATGGAALLSLGLTGTADVLPTRTATGVVPLLSLGASGTGVISAFPERLADGTVPLPTLGVSGTADVEPMASLSGGAALGGLGVTGAASVAWADLSAAGGAALPGLGASGTLETWQPLSAEGSIGLGSVNVAGEVAQWLPLTATASVALPTVNVSGTATIGAATYCILDDIATLLAPATAGWPVYKGLMPDTADGGQAIGLYERGGEPMLWGVNVDLPTVGVLVRGASMAQLSTAYQTARAMAETVVFTLHDVGPTTVNGRDYYAILSRDEPAYEGEDERQRPAFSCSFAVTAASTA